jgi:hypothetical protein
MAGLGFQSFSDVRLGKAQFDRVVEQTAQALIACVTPLNNSFSQDQANFNASWQAYYQRWVDFYQTGTDQSSTLWFPNFPDSAEWSTLVTFQAQLPPLIAQAASLYPTCASSFPTYTAPTAAAWSLGSLYPGLSPAVNATLTSLTWVGAALALLWYGGPVLEDMGVALGSAFASSSAAGSSSSPSPSRSHTRRRRRGKKA